MTESSAIPFSSAKFVTTEPDSIFHVEQFDSDERLMIQTAEQFSRSEVIPNADRLEKQEDGLMPSLIRKAGDLGLTAVDSPEEYGGLGLGKNVAARILEFLSLNASMSVTMGVTTGIGQLGLSLFGTEKQKAQYLPKIISGESISAYCLSEPNSGSDALSASTRADLRNGKWILNGTKMWISNAKWADFFLVMAKIDGSDFSAFLVERDFPGVSIAREEHKLGLKGSSTARVVLEDAELPEENLLHEPGKGHQVAFNALNLGRFKLAAMSLGPARDAVALAAQYVQDRRQFGQPIAEFGLIRQKFAEMASRYYLAESVLYRTGAYIDSAFSAWHGSVAANRRAAEEFALECSLCKILASEAEAFIVDEALQCFGGYGFTEEFPIARHFRDARVSRIYEGTNEVNRAAAASRLQRKLAAGELRVAQGNSFLGELLAEALSQSLDDQIQQGALADLTMLHYADQSARIRARATGGANSQLYAIARNWLYAQAARPYQVATGKALSLPEPMKTDWEAVSDRIYAQVGLGS